MCPCSHGASSAHLSRFGHHTWFRCRNCGATYSRKVGWTTLKNSRYDFSVAVTAELRHQGAREGGTYGWQIDNAIGLHGIHPKVDWIVCRFDDVERAKAQATPGYHNHSGKWNWHFSAPEPEDVALFIGELTRFIPGQPAPDFQLL